MKHFGFRIDIWDDTGNSIVEHIAGIDDFEVAEATVMRWPAARITLRQGIRVVHEKARIEQAVTGIRLSAEQICL